MAAEPIDELLNLVFTLLVIVRPKLDLTRKLLVRLKPLLDDTPQLHLGVLNVDIHFLLVALLVANLERLSAHHLVQAK